MKEQAWGDIFTRLKKRESRRAKGSESAKGQEGRGGPGQAREQLGTYMLGAPGRGWVPRMSAPQVFPVADDSLLSSSGTS